MGVAHVEAAAHTFSGTHRDRAHDAVAELLLDFQHQVLAAHRQRIVDRRHCVAGELDVDYRADDLYNFSTAHLVFLFSLFFAPAGRS